MNTTSRPGSLRAWCLAARPKTLSAALVPVVTGATLAFVTSHGEIFIMLHARAFVAALLCALFATLMQVASNFINDLIDFRRGADGNDRLGPERACAQGWISPRAMTWGIVVVLALAALTGLGLTAILLCALPLPPLHLLVGLLATGVACIAGALLYTTHLSRRAMGDLLVFLFFGLVPVVGTFFALTGKITLSALLLGLGVGAMVDTLLVVNNIRDIDNDRRAGKRTLIVLIGREAGHRLYLLLGLIAVACAFAAVLFTATLFPTPLWKLGVGLLLFVGFFVGHALSSRQFAQMPAGREMNRMLGITSSNMLRFAMVTVAVLLLLEG